eukprot:tig00000158_g10177.t1
MRPSKSERPKTASDIEWVEKGPNVFVTDPKNRLANRVVAPLLDWGSFEVPEVNFADAQLDADGQGATKNFSLRCVALTGQTHVFRILFKSITPSIRISFVSELIESISRAPERFKKARVTLDEGGQNPQTPSPSMLSDGNTFSDGSSPEHQTDGESYSGGPFAPGNPASPGDIPFFPGSGGQSSMALVPGGPFGAATAVPHSQTTQPAASGAAGSGNMIAQVMVPINHMGGMMQQSALSSSAAPAPVTATTSANTFAASISSASPAASNSGSSCTILDFKPKLGRASCNRMRMDLHVQLQINGQVVQANNGPSPRFCVYFAKHEEGADDSASRFIPSSSVTVVPHRQSGWQITAVVPVLNASTYNVVVTDATNTSFGRAQDLYGACSIAFGCPRPNERIPSRAVDFMFSPSPLSPFSGSKGYRLYVDDGRVFDTLNSALQGEEAVIFDRPGVHHAAVELIDAQHGTARFGARSRIVHAARLLHLELWMAVLDDGRNITTRVNLDELGLNAFLPVRDCTNRNDLSVSPFYEVRSDILEFEIIDTVEEVHKNRLGIAAGDSAASTSQLSAMFMSLMNEFQGLNVRLDLANVPRPVGNPGTPQGQPQAAGMQLNDRQRTELDAIRVHAAVSIGRLVRLLRTLPAAESRRFFSFADSLGNTLLHYACAFGAETPVGELILAGADPRAQNRLGNTPAHEAYRRNRVRVLDVLRSPQAGPLAQASLTIPNANGVTLRSIMERADEDKLQASVALLTLSLASGSTPASASPSPAPRAAAGSPGSAPAPGPIGAASHDAAAGGAAPPPASIIMDSLRKQLTCAICMDIYSDPRLLHCSHTFCATCLIRAEHAGVVVCAVCRQPTTVGAGGSLSLNKNYTVVQLSDQFRAMDKEHSGGGAGSHPARPGSLESILNPRGSAAAAAAATGGSPQAPGAPRSKLHMILNDREDEKSASRAGSWTEDGALPAETLAALARKWQRLLGAPPDEAESTRIHFRLEERHMLRTEVDRVSGKEVYVVTGGAGRSATRVEAVAQVSSTARTRDELCGLRLHCFLLYDDSLSGAQAEQAYAAAFGVAKTKLPTPPRVTAECALNPRTGHVEARFKMVIRALSPRHGRRKFRLVCCSDERPRSASCTWAFLDRAIWSAEDAVERNSPTSDMDVDDETMPAIQGVVEPDHRAAASRYVELAAEAERSGDTSAVATHLASFLEPQLPEEWWDSLASEVCQLVGNTEHRDVVRGVPAMRASFDAAWLRLAGPAAASDPDDNQTVPWRLVVPLVEEAFPAPKINDIDIMFIERRLPGGAQRTVSRARLREFWAWFYFAARTYRLTRDLWCREERVIRAFMSREEAERLLKGSSRPGTFLLRLSSLAWPAPFAGCLVVSTLRAEGDVQHYLMNPEQCRSPDAVMTYLWEHRETFLHVYGAAATRQAAYGEVAKRYLTSKQVPGQQAPAAPRATPAGPTDVNV